jgi:hypothetical protein
MVILPDLRDLLKPLVVVAIGVAAIRYVISTWATTRSGPRVVVALLVAAVVTWAVPNYDRILGDLVEPDVDHYVDKDRPILPPRAEEGSR